MLTVTKTVTKIITKAGMLTVTMTSVLIMQHPFPGSQSAYLNISNFFLLLVGSLSEHAFSCTHLAKVAVLDACGFVLAFG
jgi:uncharacterized protein YhhL (DUF1145 family)